jgi:hypothetical protein
VRRSRLRVDAVLASLNAFLLVLTLVVPDWIEVVLRVDPDAGSSELEWLTAGAFALGTVGFGLAAGRVWRLARA